MRRLICLAALVGLSVPQAGCFLYGSDDDDCVYGGGGGIADYELRNPDTGLCEWFGGSVDGDECMGYADMEQVPYPDWGECYGYCAGLDETTCLAASGCRAAYVYLCAEGEICAGLEYFGCWSTAPSGPIQGGDCMGLDAYTCSQHDDCVARHWAAGGAAGAPCADGSCEDRPEPPTIGNFESCANEPGEPPPGCFEDTECPDGFVCNAEEICLPSPYACDGTDPDSNGDGLVPCDDRCYGYCVPDDTTTGAGNCYEDVTCYCDPATGEYCAPPDCPDGTMPGVKDGCWSGYCIPVAECPDTAPACSAMTNELSCIARPDCAPIYQGVSCSCDDFGNCTCEDWLYQECVAN